MDLAALDKVGAGCSVFSPREPKILFITAGMLFWQKKFGFPCDFYVALVQKDILKFLNCYAAWFSFVELVLVEFAFYFSTK